MVKETGGSDGVEIPKEAFLRESPGVRALPTVSRAPREANTARARGSRRDHVNPEAAFVSLLRVHSGGRGDRDSRHARRNLKKIVVAQGVPSGISA